jgi:hypothetical protein
MIAGKPAITILYSQKEVPVLVECERLRICTFISDWLAKMPTVAGRMKESFCLGDKTRCARYQVAMAGFEVPPDLFPNDISKAREIIGRS